MTRVHGHAGKPASNAPLGFGVCQWCGEEFAKRDTSQLFCSAAHRTALNNLRKERGALIYDLFMTLRHDRPLARKLHVMTDVFKMLASFRRQDHEERAGRKSWMHPKTITERRPDLLAQPITQKRKG